MSILNKFLELFSNKPNSASADIAKERLQIIVAHHKHNEKDYELLGKIKRDILIVLSKYYPSADFSNINIEFEQNGPESLLQIDLTIPSNEKIELEHVDVES